MLNAVLKYLNNYFSEDTEPVTYDLTFIADGTISADFSESTIISGQYVRICGTKLNDGVYKVTAKDDSSLTIAETYDFKILTEAEITGTVQVLDIPRDLIAVIDDVTTYDATSTDGIASESQGARSITYAGDGGSGWKGIFQSKLSTYRRVRFK